MSGLHYYIAAKCQLGDLKVSKLIAFLMHINSWALIWLSKDHFSNCRAGCQFASTSGRSELDQYSQSLSSLPLFHRPILHFVYASIRRFLLRLCRQSRFYFAATHLFFFSFFHSLQTATHVHLNHCNGHSEPSPKAYTRIYISKSLSIWWQTSSTTTSSTTNIKLFVIIPRCPCKRCIVLIVGLAKTTSNTNRYTYCISWALPPTMADYYQHGQQLCLL